MINFDFVDRPESIATAAYVCWHCENPTCAQVCPADAIKKYEDGVVGSSLKPRCIGCSNCVLACPFGIPKLVPEYEQMMKCDMCYDRTSVGKKPMCATVCPSQALAYGPLAEILNDRPGVAVNEWHFGREVVRTKVYVMAPEPARIEVGLISLDASGDRKSATPPIDDVAALLGDAY